MIAEMRTYTIKDGMIDSYLELYNRQIVPNHRKYGINVLGAWYDRQKNQVIWIRTFASREERKAKLDIYEVSPERDAVFPIASYHMVSFIPQLNRISECCVQDERVHVWSKQSS